MYAIKIQNSESTTFHEANEVTYKFRNYSNKQEFLNKTTSEYYSYQLGDTPTEDKEGYFLDIGFYRDEEVIEEKHACIIPGATVYIMQDGKTIEIVKV